MGRVFLMRHGSVENPRSVLYGRMEGFALSAAGREQAREAADFMAHFPLAAVVSSSLTRAVETAKIMAERNPGQPALRIDDRIIEPDWGEYEGMDVKAFDSRREHYLRLQNEGTGGLERPADIAARLYSAVLSHTSEVPDSSLLFVSHADPISFLLSTLDGEDLQPAALRQYPLKASVLETNLVEGSWIHRFTPSIADF